LISRGYPFIRIQNHIYQFLEDDEGYRHEVRYIRDKDGGEIDFAIFKEGKL
jgi:hypothetical protein